MRAALGGPRVLLRRLREVMAEPVSAQERLDKIVVLIAANMVAEVCSVYVLRVDGTLELYATEGLKKEAVHQTVLRQDEGLVGLVASEANPINLSQAQDHPAFSYRPETGEENYHSFLGVPVLRAGNTLGVLVVQNRARRTYSEEEEEALQTTAMVLAEMIASGELSTLARPGVPEPAARTSGPTTVGGTETILIAEDADAVRELACRVLRTHGYTVLEAKQAPDALDIARAHAGTIHLLLTDVVMPELSGRELARRLEALRPGVPVLYMSGYTDETIVSHGTLEPGLAYLPKPFTPQALVRKVREVLDSG